MRIIFLLFILFSFNLRAEEVCETFSGITTKEELCFNNKIKGWLSKSCSQKKCDALKFFDKKPKKKVKIPTPEGGQNPAALYCHVLKFPVVILRDATDNEQSLCQFEDGSLVDVNAVEGFLE